MKCEHTSVMLSRCIYIVDDGDRAGKLHETMIDISFENIPIQDIKYGSCGACDTSSYVVLVRSCEPSSYAMPGVSEHHRMCQWNIQILHIAYVDLAMIQHTRACKYCEHGRLRGFSSFCKEKHGNRKNHAAHDE
jgi:hypothetical protein